MTPAELRLLALWLRKLHEAKKHIPKIGPQQCGLETYRLPDMSGNEKVSFMVLR